MMTIQIKMEFSCMGFFHAYSFEISLNFMCWALYQLSTAGPYKLSLTLRSSQPQRGEQYKPLYYANICNKRLQGTDTTDPQPCLRQGVPIILIFKLKNTK